MTFWATAGPPLIFQPPTMEQGTGDGAILHENSIFTAVTVAFSARRALGPTKVTGADSSQVLSAWTITPWQEWRDMHLHHHAHSGRASPPPQLTAPQNAPLRGAR